ncbi:acyltransferase family protein [Neptuniibacter halophilus]|uniref:acyltransferase family protein n=1 Tax=Neptuniibacter halophilus TaxID=651666 RepID=UPI0025748B6E|nr:acyltransferase family protein [Neptuniibacter halophilus]
MLVHFNVPYFNGGFIGVDVFFVISGFLISALIHQDMQNSRFSFADFYNRRIKRLAPATILAVIATTIAFGLILLPEDFTRYIRSARDVFLFKSNVHFAKETSDYFSAEADAIPLLHTWSLAVEWQFYFIFPALFYCVVRFLSGSFLAIFGALSLAMGYSLYASYWQGEVYYHTSARAFEFLVGTGVFLLAQKRTVRLPSFVVPFSIAGLIVIATQIDGTWQYPGVPAVLVSLFTAAILYSGQSNKFLTSSVMGWIGKHSYSAYLWHWPLVVFFYHQGETHNPFMIPMLFVLTFALSFLSYRFVENPIRRSKMKLGTSLLILVVLPVFGGVAAYYFARKNDGWPQRLGEVEGRAYQQIAKYEDPMRKVCHVFTGTNLEQCAFGETKNPKGSLLLLGDSHGLHIKRFVEVLAKDASLKAYTQTESECLMLVGDYQSKMPGRAARCSKRTAELYHLIDGGQFDYVVLSERWRGYSLPRDEGESAVEAYQEALTESIERVINAGSQPVIIKPVAEGNGTNFTLCFYNNIAALDVCDIDHQESNRLLKGIYEMMDLVAEQYPSVIFIDPQTVQCSAGVCKTHEDGIPWYQDTHHIYDYTAQKLAKDYLAEFNNPLR